MIKAQELDDALTKVKTDIQNVTQLIVKKPDLNKQYKTEAGKLRMYAASLGSAQGHVLATQSLPIQEAKQLIETANTEVMPIIVFIIGRNSDMLGLSSMSMNKAIEDSNAKQLNALLGTLEEGLQALTVALHTVVASTARSAEDSPTTQDVSRVETVPQGGQVPPPSMGEIKKNLGAIEQAIEKLTNPAPNGV